MVFGYCRVSAQSQDENLARQIEPMKAEGIDERNIYIDVMSGKSFNRPSYNTLVGTKNNAPMLREGDLLVVLSIDRLGRNYTEIMEQWKYITKELKADIKVLDMPLLDTSNKVNNLDGQLVTDIILMLLSYVAQKERENINERQKQGIACMKTNAEGKRIGKKGNPTGRPSVTYPSNWEEMYAKWKNKEITATKCIEMLELKRTTFYKLVNEYERVNNPVEEQLNKDI